MADRKRPAALGALTGQVDSGLRNSANPARIRADFQDPSQSQMSLRAFKPLVKNSLRGFASVELSIGLVLTHVPVLVSHGKAWAALPSKPVLDREGRQAEVDGKRQYAPILEWRDRSLAD